MPRNLLPDPDSEALIPAQGAMTPRTVAAREVAIESALAALAPGRSAGPGDTPEGVVTAFRRLEAVRARHAPFPPGIDSRLREALAERGLTELYTHQAEAVAHALAGRNVVVTTPTASGKTLCYNIPVLNSVLGDPSTRAFYLFPTKALAQDQLAELDRLSGALARRTGEELGVFTYDGDTPQDARRAIRGRAKIVLTNPDMLHAGILPHHTRWAKVFENLRFVVIDELHAFRGVFGSHLANVLRRLKRVCRHYGSAPVFICSSATIANPRTLAERLTEEKFEHVSESGAPRGEKLFLFVNPPVVNHQLGIRRSYIAQARSVALEFLRRNLQVIVFAQNRLATEILTRYLKDAFEGAPGASDVIRGYRGGYLPKRRREIEKGLRDGKVRGVVATNALELGIDIGALDVAVLAGYPGTVAATWQRAGRAGRRAGRSAAVLVATSSPVDQYVVRHPSYFFDRSPEHALINPDNLHILLDHVKCAAFELPFSARETFGRHPVQEVLAVLEESGFVHLAEGDPGGPDEASWHWTSESYPADAVSLRSVSSDNFVVVDTTDETRVIGETDFHSGPSTLHPKAIYIVEGTLYQVERLDFEGRKAYVRQIDCDYYTDAITYSRVTILDCFERGAGGLNEEYEDTGRADTRMAAAAAGLEDGERGKPLEERAELDRSVGWGEGVRFLPARGEDETVPLDLESVAAHGEVHVVSRVVGFKKIKFYTNENVGSGELDLPEQQMHTTSYWLTIPRQVMSSLQFDSEDRRDGVVGLSFAMGHVARLLLMCEAQDIGISIGSSSSSRHEPAGLAGAVGGGPAAAFGCGPADLDEPRIFIYDNYPGGIGFSEPLYRMHRSLLARTRDLIRDCPCESGCPSCVGPLGQVGPLAKTVALRLLGALGS
ncbi:MAG: DEAD/DEAH box helicase [Vicinamibacterales bacterium]